MQARATRSCAAAPAPEDDNLVALGMEALHDLVDLFVEGLPVVSVPRILQVGFVNSQRAILSTT